MLSLLLLLAAIQLPDHVASPGAARLALGLGVERGAPAVEARLGLLPWLAVEAEGVFWEAAPLLGAKLRVAADARRGLFTHGFFIGHLRPLLSLDVISGADAGGGLGIASRLDHLTTQLDAGVLYGLCVEPAGVDLDAPDQRGGLWIMQRLSLSYDLCAHCGVEGHLDVQIPFERAQLDSGAEELGRWRLTLGLRAFLRL
ncbi:hypothetical protein KKF91_18775 [Myxococcota bacterium]|nr:hypothetical protein [Myxococcota bacterium]MBU1432588.1 hypothetical protein [Myxococcota bacterium]MBU1898176.1 hypothetical protein [Myxococcota bacterium]